MDDLRARILGAKSRWIFVDMPEWGEDVRVGLRRLSLAERLAFEAANGALNEINAKQDPDRYTRWFVRYVIATAVDDRGERLFHAEDEESLLQAPAVAIERLCIAAMRFNTMTAQEVARVGEASGEARNGASPSGSPVTSG